MADDTSFYDLIRGSNCTKRSGKFSDVVDDAGTRCEKVRIVRGWPLGHHHFSLSHNLGASFSEGLPHMEQNYERICRCYDVINRDMTSLVSFGVKICHFLNYLVRRITLLLVY